MRLVDVEVQIAADSHGAVAGGKLAMVGVAADLDAFAAGGVLGGLIGHRITLRRASGA